MEPIVLSTEEKAILADGLEDSEEDGGCLDDAERLPNKGRRRRVCLVRRI